MSSNGDMTHLAEKYIRQWAKNYLDQPYSVAIIVSTHRDYGVDAWTLRDALYNRSEIITVIDKKLQLCLGRAR